MAPFDHHLQAAQGYLELGMALEANEQMECIPAGIKVASGVLAVCMEVSRV